MSLVIVGYGTPRFGDPAVGAAGNLLNNRIIVGARGLEPLLGDSVPDSSTGAHTYRGSPWGYTDKIQLRFNGGKVVLSKWVFEI